MTVQYIQGFAFEAIKVMMVVSAPTLLVALVVGLSVSILQATTQINEMTVSYIPKIIAIYGTLVMFSGFMIDRLADFTTKILSDFSRFTQ